MSSSEVRWGEALADEAAADDAPALGHHPAWDPLVPDVDLPLGHMSVYRTVSVTDVAEDDTPPRELSAPIDLLAAPLTRARRPAVGVVLTHEQAWRMKGVTLGRLVNAVSLAPGEVTQVATTQWERTGHGESAEDVRERERAARDAGRTRETHDVTTAVARELQTGASTTSATSTTSSLGVGGLLGLVAGSNASGSSVDSSASSVAFSTGSRSVSADSTQRVSETTQQHASNVRGRRATLVQETTQSDTERFETRVVANYNHTHALTMMYFEVLQEYELAARVVDVERCVFVPLALRHFASTDDVRDFAAPLARAAAAMGRPELAAAIAQLDETDDQRRHRADRLAAAAAAAATAAGKAATAVADAGATVATARAGLAAALGDRDRLAQQLTAGIDQQRRLLENRSRLEREIIVKAEELVIGHAPAIDAIDTRLVQVRHDVAALSAEQAAAARAVTAATTAFGAAARALATAQAEEARARTVAAGRAADVRTATEAAHHADTDLLAQLASEELAFNQAIWAQLEPAQVGELLAGRRHAGRLLTETLDPQPIAIVGNLVAFRWGFGAHEAAEAAEFVQRHLGDDGDSTDRSTVVLPTGGVFAEAVPGRATSAEKIDLRRFWKWDDTTIPILPTPIAALHQQRHAQVAEAAPGSLDASAATLAALPDAPAGPTHALAGLAAHPLFRDLTGSDTIADLLTSTQEQAGASRTDAMAHAQESVSSFLDTLEELAPQAIAAYQQHRTKSRAADKAGGEGDLDATDVGGLQNALGEGEEGSLDVGELVGEAAELGLFL